MIRLLAVLILSVLPIAAALAEGLTCKTFRTRLESQLRRSGLTDLTVSEGRQSQTNPHTSYGLAIGPGLTGTMECFAADRLQETDYTADLKALSPKDAAARSGQFRTLATAAACSVSAARSPGCRDSMAALFARSRRQLAMVTSRGDPLPESDETADLSPDATLDLFAKPDGMQFAIFLKQSTDN